MESIVIGSKPFIGQIRSIRRRGLNPFISQTWVGERIHLIEKIIEIQRQNGRNTSSTLQVMLNEIFQAKISFSEMNERYLVTNKSRMRPIIEPNRVLTLVYPKA